jgi:hypothetical protein
MYVVQFEYGRTVEVLALSHAGRVLRSGVGFQFIDI